ncbi:hypothetical protein [Streptomyces smyrnaeus]|uniref:hypothetical protein n=1 Tax=Streptomyces smyrnaeus TaxID=1387713 RepID=UPI00368DA913
MSTPQGVRERGELFSPRFELFADVLSVGLATAVAALPLVTAPAALSTACAVLRRRRLYDEPCTARRYLAALRTREDRRGDLAAGAVLLAACALLAADAALVAAGLPGAGQFAVFLAAAAAVAALVGLRACAGYRAGAGHGWREACRDAAGRAVRDVPGSVLVLLALCTAGMCVWALPPLLFLVAGPLAVALTAVELRLR